MRSACSSPSDLRETVQLCPHSLIPAVISVLSCPVLSCYGQSCLLVCFLLFVRSCLLSFHFISFHLLPSILIYFQLFSPVAMKVDAKNSSGMTPVILAAQAGHSDAVRLLLGSGTLRCPTLPYFFRILLIMPYPAISSSFLDTTLLSCMATVAAPASLPRSYVADFFRTPLALSLCVLCVLMTLALSSSSALW